MSNDNFDYGDKLEDGQYENHPTIEDGEIVQPVRRAYVHEKCDETMRMSDDLAESVARDPTYYSKTFCASCGEYVSVEEVSWVRDGANWEIDDEYIEGWMEGRDE